MNSKVRRSELVYTVYTYILCGGGECFHTALYQRGKEIEEGRKMFILFPKDYRVCIEVLVFEKIWWKAAADVVLINTYIHPLLFKKFEPLHGSANSKEFIEDVSHVKNSFY